MLKIKSLNQFKSGKILEIGKVAKIIEKVKLEGKTIGLCHGGFDLTHPGHVIHFESAKKLCDVLVVSITSDRFVNSRKGSGRPIYCDRLRAYMVAGLEAVDYVVISDFAKGVNVIRLLKPSFYIKGSDFINKKTLGIESERIAIKDIGGGMRYTHDLKLSTTEIINYIKKEISLKRILIIIDRDGTLITNNNFLGKNNKWNDEIKFNKDVLSLISHIQTKSNATKIVVTNQAGVARGLFDCKRVEEINKSIDASLKKKGINIDNWQYCPDVDLRYAKKHPELGLNPKFIKTLSKRKPNISMVINGLQELRKEINQFDEIIVLGDRDEDKELAENLKARFIFYHNGQTKTKNYIN